MWLTDKAAGHWDLVIPSAIAAAFILPGIVLAAAGDATAADDGTGMLVVALMFYVPWLAGYLMGARKRRMPLKDAIYEIHATNGRMQEMLSGPRPDPAGQESRKLTLVRE